MKSNFSGSYSLNANEGLHRTQTKPLKKSTAAEGPPPAKHQQTSPPPQPGRPKRPQRREYDREQYPIEIRHDSVGRNDIGG